MEVHGRNIVSKAIRISSDSKAVLHGLGGNKITYGVILPCRNTLELISRNNTDLAWIKGHVPNRGNEETRTGSRLPIWGPEPVLPQLICRVASRKNG